MKRRVLDIVECWGWFDAWDQQRSPKTAYDKRAALRCKTLALIAEDRAHG